MKTETRILRSIIWDEQQGSSWKNGGSFGGKFPEGSAGKFSADIDILMHISYTYICVTGCGSAWLERLVWDQEAAGSNPVTPIFLCRKRRRPAGITAEEREREAL